MRYFIFLLIAGCSTLTPVPEPKFGENSVLLNSEILVHSSEFLDSADGNGGGGGGSSGDGDGGAGE